MCFRGAIIVIDKKEINVPCSNPGGGRVLFCVNALSYS